MTTFYLVGSSGVGKTTTAGLLAKRGVCVHREASTESRNKAGAKWHKSPETDWQIIQPVLTDMEAHQGSLPLMVVLGAGTQLYGQLNNRAIQKWLDSRKDRVIWLQSSHEEAYRHYRERAVKHRHGASKTFPQFVKVEFDPLRTDLYSVAGLRVDVNGQTVSQTADAVTSLINQYGKASNHA
jgi:hypothetical protein